MRFSFSLLLRQTVESKPFAEGNDSSRILDLGRVVERVNPFHACVPSPVIREREGYRERDTQIERGK